HTQVLAADPLAQYERVLGADRHDEGEPGHQSGKERRSHQSNVQVCVTLPTFDPSRAATWV
ncbi:hypothetical protein, partial [Staphylococcus warneri]|uniref:hypothetical protein n=1 Tax=Staphylococcus warneri TaxID=1292 RepID=UPI0030C08565